MVCLCGGYSGVCGCLRRARSRGACRRGDVDRADGNIFGDPEVSFGASVRQLRLGLELERPSLYVSGGKSRQALRRVLPRIEPDQSARADVHEGEPRFQRGGRARPQGDLPPRLPVSHHVRRQRRVCFEREGCAGGDTDCDPLLDVVPPDDRHRPLVPCDLVAQSVRTECASGRFGRGPQGVQRRVVAVSPCGAGLCADVRNPRGDR